MVGFTELIAVHSGLCVGLLVLVCEKAWKNSQRTTKAEIEWVSETEGKERQI